MDLRKHLGALLLLGAAAAAAAGCSASLGDDAEAQEGELRPLERRAIGAAVPYEPDLELRARLGELASSQKARRQAAWKAVAKILKPVKLADERIAVNGEAPSVPLFRTWYGKDDFERMFGKMYSELTPEERRARRPFTQKEIQAIFDWNARSLGSATEEDYFARIKLLDGGQGIDGLGGNHRVSYSPGLVGHVIGEYGNLFSCLEKLEGIKADDEPPSDTNFAPCMGREFPEDAALVKMSWYRASFGQERLPLPVYDTSASTLAKKISGESDQGGWGKGVSKADPEDATIYTVQMSDGTKFRMPALHLVTKELRDWFWITLWWSPNPDEDFGADRPDEIKALGGPWAHYKMHVSVAFEENDPDPRGGYEGSLGEALAATYGGVGGPSWVSNPYVERGAHNAQTNCIGCHQHGGTRESSESILASPEKFPHAGRTKVRKNFPMDYLFALTSAPERLAGIVEDQVRHYDALER